MCHQKLVRAMTREDLDRLEKLAQAGEQLAEVARCSAEVFRQYQTMHLAKKTDYGTLKAQINGDYALMCERAVAAYRAALAKEIK